MIRHRIDRPEGMSDEDWAAARRKAMQVLDEVTPVRSGRLRSGWNSVLTPEFMLLVNETPYAEFVNDGTPRMSPRDMTGQVHQALGF